jgi:hypothetical protein
MPPEELGGVALVERRADTILALANPACDSGLFVWAAHSFLAVVADSDGDTPLAPVGCRCGHPQHRWSQARS